MKDLKYENESSKEKYSYLFRILKTLLMIYTWISFGIICEIFGPAFEDLRIYLNADYNQLSLLISLKSFSYLFVITFCGILFDKLSIYSDTIMGVSTLLLIVPNILITFTTTYWVIGLGFVLQGFGNALYDVGGNKILLDLWKGISNSPVNAMHAGYGIGALLAVQIIKPFIQFDPLSATTKDLQQANNNTTNLLNQALSTSETNTTSLQIRIPFWISAFMGLSIAILFILAQLFEIRNHRKYEKAQGTHLKSTLLDKSAAIYSVQTEIEESAGNNFLDKLFFGQKKYKTYPKIYMYSQIILATSLLFYLQGYSTLISRFTLTYLTLGPAKLSINSYTNLQTLYWITFVVSRFSAAFIAFKLNPLVFVFILTFVNTLTSSFLLIPYFTHFELFYWIVLAIKGVTSGPCIPSIFMVAKHVMRDYNSFIISIFSIGLGAGPLIFQQLTGIILDTLKPPQTESFLGFGQFNSTYFIGHLIFASSALSFAAFLLIVLIYKKCFYLIK